MDEIALMAVQGIWAVSTRGKREMSADAGFGSIDLSLWSAQIVDMVKRYCDKSDLYIIGLACEVTRQIIALDLDTDDDIRIVEIIKSTITQDTI